jgi:putative membrane protein
MNTLILFLANGPHDGWDGPWWIFPPLFFLFWLTVAAVIFWRFRRGRWHHDDSGMRAGSDVLAERFARGEISHEEYTERLGQLRRAVNEHRKASR